MLYQKFLNVRSKIPAKFYRMVVWGCLPIILFLQGCCSCTEKACNIADVPIIDLWIDLNDYPELVQEDLENVVIIQTDNDYNKLDSLSAGFVPVAFGSDQLMLSVDFNMFSTSDQLSDYHYLIRNIPLNQTDTISQLNYDVSTSEEICNECSGGLSCEDEKHTVYHFSSPTYAYNDVIKSSFEIDYEVK